MMRLLTTFTLMAFCFTAIGQSLTRKTEGWKRAGFTYYPYTYIDTESMYSESGITVIIQNSLPKGGAYTTAPGKSLQYRIFWTRVINETDSPIELTINFPADSFARNTDRDSYLKLFLPADTMSLEKEILFGYGIKDIGPYLDHEFNKLTMFQRTLNPKEASVFYIVAVFPGGQGYGVPARAGLVLKEQEFFYTTKGLGLELDSTLIPCGRITVKK